MSVSQRFTVPPIMKPSVSFQMPMDVDTLTTESSARSNTYGPPQHTTVPMPQHQTLRQVTNVCCSVSRGKAELNAMLHNFQEDLDRIIANTFGETLPLRPMSQVDVDASSAPPPFLCSSCAQHRQGTWYSCDNCHVIVVRIDKVCQVILTKCSSQCEACQDAARPGFCLNVMGRHQMKLVSSTNSESYVPIPRLPFPWVSEPESSDTTGISNTNGETSSASSAVSSPSPVIHKGVACDICNKTIEGIRHKCLDCPGQFLTVWHQ